MFFAACGAGVLIGFACGGRLRGLAEVPLRIFVLPWLAFAVQLALPLVPARFAGLDLRFPLVTASTAVAGGAVLVLIRTTHLRRPVLIALLCVLLGWLLNALVIVANRGMPVSVVALRRAGASGVINPAHLGLLKHVLATPRTALRTLADVIPLPRLATAISVGDVLILLGIAAFLAATMQGRPEFPAAVAVSG